MTAKTVLHNFIGGAPAAPAEGRYEDLIDPATVRSSAPTSETTARAARSWCAAAWASRSSDG